MITATRPGHYITRNISFFKKVLQQEIQHNSEDACDEDEDYSKLDNNLPDTNIEVNNELAERLYPARDRRPINTIDSIDMVTTYIMLSNFNNSIL